jgi:hypothetical protein
MTRPGRVRGALAALSCVAVLASCGEGGAEEKKADEDPSPSTSGPAPTVTVPVFDDDHAMDPPGPLQGPLVPADILIYAEDTLSEEMVEEITALKGVHSVEQLSLASASIENHVFTIASVDPASYRRFTSSGKQDEIWARVAGGEVATDKAVADKVANEESFIKLGSEKDAPEVHVGAYAPQAGNIDIVVNEEWGEEVLETHDNALLISTFKTSPQSIRKPLQEIVGKDASIQNLDSVARYGLDPKAKLTAVPTGGSVGEAIGVFRYSVAGQQVIPDSSWVAENIVTDTVPLLGRVTCHKVMMPQLKAALAEVVQRGLGEHVYQHVGCYYPRFIANSTRLSNHAFGMAIDINSLENQRGTKGQMHPEVVDIFKSWGFGWGGDWSWTDPMHFELNRVMSVG